MAGARDHRDQLDDHGPAGVTRPAAAPVHAPAIAGPGDPRLAHGGAQDGLMRLQRTAGNAAVTSDGGGTTISGSSIHLDAPMVDAPGVVRVGTIIADTVVGSSYTPGAGNVW